MVSPFLKKEINLIPSSCPECKKEISPDAVVCQNCGSPTLRAIVPKNSYKKYLEADKSMGRFSKILMAVTAAIGIGFFVINLPKPQVSAEAGQGVEKGQALGCYKRDDQKISGPQYTAKDDCQKRENDNIDKYRERQFPV